MQEVPLTTKVVISTHAHGEVYSIQLLCDQVYQWLAAGRWFSQGTPVTPTNKTESYDITLDTVQGDDKHHHSNPLHYI
jgi:hypothetical protein